MTWSTSRIAASLVAVGCDAPPVALPPASMVPGSFTVDVGVRLGDLPVRTPDGQALAAQTYLRLDLKATWSTPSPEPNTQCSAVWTWDDSPTLVRPAPDWATTSGAVAAVMLDPATADWRSTDCTLLDDVPAEALLGGGLGLALGPNPYLRWQDALKLLPDVAISGVDAWPWLDATHVFGVELAVLSPTDGPPVGARPGVAVAMALDAQNRLVPFHGGLLETLPSDAVLADGEAPDTLLRARSLETWTLAFPDR